MLRPDDRWLNAEAQDKEVSVTVLLRPPEGLADQILSGHYHPASQDSAEQSTAANPQQLAAVRDFAAQNGLHVISEDAASRRVVLTGTVAQMNQAFGIQLGNTQDASGHSFLGYQGEVQLPANLQKAVTAVLGLDQRPVARHAGQG